MFDVGIGGSPAENYENLIRGSRKSAPGQGEFEMELEFADIQAERAAEHQRREAEKFKGGVQGLIQDERNRPFRWWERNEPRPTNRHVFLPKVRGAEQMGRHISGQAEEAAARREEIRNRPLPLGPGQHPGGHIQQDSRDRYPPRNR